MMACAAVPSGGRHGASDTMFCSWLTRSPNFNGVQAAANKQASTAATHRARESIVAEILSPSCYRALLSSNSRSIKKLSEKIMW